MTGASCASVMPSSAAWPTSHPRPDQPSAPQSGRLPRHPSRPSTWNSHHQTHGKFPRRPFAQLATAVPEQAALLHTRRGRDGARRITPCRTILAEARPAQHKEWPTGAERGWLNVPTRMRGEPQRQWPRPRRSHLSGHVLFPQCGKLGTSAFGATSGCWPWQARQWASTRGPHLTITNPIDAAGKRSALPRSIPTSSSWHRWLTSKPDHPRLSRPRT